MALNVTPETRQEEIDLILATVDEFSRDVLEPAFRSSEKVLAPAAISGLVDQLSELGIFPEGQKTGFEIWGNPDSATGLHLSRCILQRLARANAGLAMAVHLRALGACLGESLSPKTAHPAIPVVQGRNGLAKGALARFLVDTPLSESEHRQVVEYFPGTPGSSLPVYFHALSGWQSIIFPTLSDNGRLFWVRVPRESMDTHPIENTHGLNELPLWEIATLPDPERFRINLAPAVEPKSLLTKMLALSALAAMAIALGATQKAHAIARQYACERVQGGKAIIGHAAVQLLLGTLGANIGAVENMLASCSMPVQKASDLQSLFRCRAVAHPLLCQAANAAVQILGGYGYMQDMGVEKILRDNNQLKLMFGTPGDLKLFVAMLENSP